MATRILGVTPPGPATGNYRWGYPRRRKNAPCLRVSFCKNLIVEKSYFFYLAVIHNFQKTRLMPLLVMIGICFFIADKN